MLEAANVEMEKVEAVNEARAKKAAAAEKRLTRDMIRMLDGVQTYLRQAQASLASDDIARHDSWVMAASESLIAYSRLAMTRSQGTPADC